MATDLTHGYIYFLEKDAGDNQDWGNVVGDIDLDNFTNGTDVVKLQIPQDFKIRGKTGINVIDSGGGRSYDERTNRRAYAMLSNGIETTIANAMTVVNFFMLDRHCSGASAIFKRIYAVIILFDGTYVPFIDSGSTPRDYCTGAVLDWEVDWDQGDNVRATVRLNWKSVW